MMQEIGIYFTHNLIITQKSKSATCITNA